MVKTIDKPAKTSALQVKVRRELPPGKVYNDRGQIVFAKGFSGNPAGKKKGSKHFTTLLKEMVLEYAEIKEKGKEKGEKIRIDRAMSLAMIKKAIMDGDVAAFNAITNRTDGLPAQSIEMEVSTPPVPIYSGKSLVVKAKTIRNGTSTGKNKI